MEIQIKPIGRFVLIKAFKPDAGAIEMPNFVPPDAQRQHQRGMEIYRVLAVGEGRLMQDGKIVEHTLKPGDEVILLSDTPLGGGPGLPLYGRTDEFIIDSMQVIAVVTGREGDKLPAPPLPEIVRGRMNTKELAH